MQLHNNNPIGLLLCNCKNEEPASRASGDAALRGLRPVSVEPRTGFLEDRMVHQSSNVRGSQGLE